MEIDKLNSLVELYFKKCDEVDPNRPFLKWLKPNKPTYTWGDVKERIFKLSTKIKTLINEGDRCLILFLVIFVAIWVEEWDRITSFIQRAGLIAFILNLTMIFLGYYLAKYLASGVEQRKCISLECGLQNGTLALFVTTQLFDDVVFAVPTAAYALIMFTTATIFVLIVRKIN